ncbi:MAG TPA: phosphoribosylglycinamide formyltransferase, partial [Chromatiaceae bacterium]|nr:phosphoribosylglycinamide formyltransferase [Chromatiaceae bacterium]
VIAQARVPVRADDDEERLAARVLAREHRLYPTVVEWFARGRLRLRDDRVELDGKALAAPVAI